MLTLRLAVANVRKSWRDYAVYFVTLMLGVALFYAFNTVQAQADMLPQRRQIVIELGRIIVILTWFLAAILAFLMVYANNYLVRRRAKELGLYQVLGMRRRRVAAILATETALSSLAALAAGLAVGVAASQFLVFITAKAMGTLVSNYHFVFAADAFVLTITVFVTIFVATLLLNLATLRRLRLVELMGAGSRNEGSVFVRRPWLAAVVFIAGAILIGIAYWRLSTYGYTFFSVSVGPDASDATNQQAWARFWVTTALVVLGTYFVFFAFGGMLLAATRSAGTFYWRGLTMFTIRELAGRVRTSAASMATIALVLFVMLSLVTASFGVASALRTSLSSFAPHDLTFGLSDWEDPKSNEVTLEVLEEWGATQTSVAASAGKPAEGTFEGHKARWTAVRTWSASLVDFSDPEKPRRIDVSEDSDVYLPPVDVFLEAAGQKDLTLSGARIEGTGLISLPAVALSDYNAVRELVGLKPLTLPEGTYAIALSSPVDQLRDIYTTTVDSGAEIPVLGQRLVPVGAANSGGLDESAAAVFSNSFTGENMGTLIVPDALVASLAEREQSPEVPVDSRTTVIVDFDEDLSDEQTIAAGKTLIKQHEAQVAAGNESSFGWMLSQPASAASLKEDVIRVAGLVTFIAVYIGLVMAMAAAAVLAIKVLSSATEATGRYRRLRELGCPRPMATRSLAVQVALFFALPLALAAAHAFVAVREVSELVSLFTPINLTNSMLTAGGFTVAIFAVYYALTFITARTVALTREHTAS